MLWSQEGALCALDMLSVSGLINYIGKIDLAHSAENAQQEGIAVKPILLRKGKSKLALYGVGNIKDARMHFELRSNRVKMYMPKDKNDWFNVLLLHQNRYGGSDHFCFGVKLELMCPPSACRTGLSSPSQRACLTTVLTLSCGATNMTAVSSQKRSQASVIAYASQDHR